MVAVEAGVDSFEDGVDALMEWRCVDDSKQA